MAERLQKFLAKSGIGSRRFCETLIKSKRIKINGVIAEIGVSVTKNDFIESLYPDYCFLVNDKNIIYPHHLKTELAGYHGGLSKEEIKIPIIEISNF